MSHEHAHKFIEHAQKDTELRAKIKAHINESGIEAVAKEHGYEFTHEEMHAAMKKKWSSKEDPNFCFVCF